MAGTRTLAVGLLCASLGACAPFSSSRTDSQERKRQLPPPPYSIATLSEYKRGVAHRIVRASRDTYHEPMPEVMKSIVVLEITVDGAGRATAVSVYRSNGYKHLEQRALASVAAAAPFAPPLPALLEGGASVSFLETFLFRDDDFFQVRSLVPEYWEPSTRERLF
jgi:TonB family protein